MAFESNWDILIQAADSAGQPQVVAGGSVVQVEPSWSHDGRTLIFKLFAPATQADLWFQILGDGSAPHKLLATTFNEATPRPSPD